MASNTIKGIQNLSDKLVEVFLHPSLITKVHQEIKGHPQEEEQEGASVCVRFSKYTVEANLIKEGGHHKTNKACENPKE